MRCLIVLLALLVPSITQAQPTPREALKKLKLPKGLKIELVACEPQIESPVFMAFDPKGKLWVVEMRDYPNGPAPGKPPQGRIRILEDKDGDGFFETSNIFADNLLFANGLLHWKDGVIVTAAPHIAWLRDTDGDGKMDTKEILYQGFAALNPQLRVSHPILGLDGWIYVANGLRGGQVISAKPQAGKKPVNLSGMDFRFDMLTGKHEAISGMGQFGNTFDDWGNRFVCDNRHHLRHIVIEDRYLKRNPHLAVPGVVEDISELGDGPLNSGGKIYPLSKNWTTSNLHEGRFTAACGVHIYRGDLLPKPYQGAAFTCDPTGNLVHGETMEPHGATFKSKPLQNGVEFLASPDDWFRPVSLAGGPDGALYVVDMCRAVIEHPEFMPPELRNRADLILGKDKGRIWRIVPEDHKRSAIAPLPQSLVELVDLLESKNAWKRMTAQRLLLERQHPNSLVRLAALLDHGSPLAKAHAAWLLDRCVKLFEIEISRLLLSKEPRLVEQGLKLAEPRLLESAKLQKIVLGLAPAEDGRLLFQQALTLGELGRNAAVIEPLEKILRQGGGSYWARQAVYSAVPEQAGEVLAAFRKNGPRPKQIQELASLVGARQSPEEIALVFKANDNCWSHYILLGLLEGMSRRGTHFETFLKKNSDPRLLASWKSEVKSLEDSIARNLFEPKQLIETLPLLAHAEWSASLEKTFARALKDADQQTSLAVVRAIAAHSHADVPKLLTQGWRGYTPALRKEVTEAMMRNPMRIGFLLDEVAAGRIKSGDVDVVRTRQLLNSSNVAIRNRAQKLLKDNIPADRKLVLARYQESLKLKGDPKAGQAIFKKNCATCHKIAGVGIDVAPDISDTRTKTFEALLTDILSPNQAIDNNYVNYLVTTKSGKSVTGILTAETGTSITLKRAEGQTDVLLRAEIDEIQSTGVSLMPEGMEKTITVREMADLLSFLKNWRYLDGNVPLATP